jgi:hypothetical protein
MRIGKKKTESQVNSKRIAIDRMQRFNPLRDLTPVKLMQYHEEFNAGRIKSAARMWEAIERTDDMIKTVAPKRKKAVSRHGYEVVKIEDSEKAERHAAALQFFYDNLIATRCDDRNMRGGVPLLVRNMMDAEGKKYAAHEIVWKAIDGGLTAELIFTPLWYFENTTGRLRYLTGLSELTGSDLEPAEWMVHTGEGIMESCAVAYLLKHLPLQDWLIYSEKFGMPIPVGKSPDQPGSDGWVAMEEAVGAIGECDGAVISNNASMEFPNFGSAQNLPYPALIERMDRALAALWRGADLSTMSKGDGTGASMQMDEMQMLEDDDADHITDTLNEQLDRFVILYATGDTVPLAWVKIKTGIRDDTKGDLEVDKALHEIGWQQPAEELERRYGRTGLEMKQSIPLANEKETTTIDQPNALLKNARKAMAKAIAEDLRPVADRIAEILDATPDGDLFAALKSFQTDELPDLARKALAGNASADALEQTMVAALFNGLEEE